MADITKVYAVTISGILVLTYDEDGDIPQPDTWDTSLLLDELTLTMHTAPSVRLALVYYNRDTGTEDELNSTAAMNHYLALVHYNRDAGTEDSPDSKEAE